MEINKNLFVKIVGIGLLMMMLVFHSCNKDSFQNIGFLWEFENQSSGKTIMYSEKTGSHLSLEGDLELKRGAVKVFLIDPMGDTVYLLNMRKPGHKYIHERFISIEGFWSLQYKSLDGVGEINLHLVSQDN